MLDVAGVHAERRQRERSAQAAGKREQSTSGIGYAERTCDPAHGVRCRSGVVGNGIGQHDGVGRGMGQPQAAQHMAEFVMQRHSDQAQAGAASPGTVQRIRPGSLVGRIPDDCRQRRTQ